MIRICNHRFIHAVAQKAKQTTVQPYPLSTCPKAPPSRCRSESKRSTVTMPSPRRLSRSSKNQI